MRIPALVASLVLALPVLFGLTGCEQVFQQHSDSQRELADAALKEKNYPEAVRLYESCLDGTPRSAEAHYQLGSIYDTQLDQPLNAVHHFQRYLELTPEGSKAKDVSSFIKEDHLKLITRFGNGAVMPQQEAVRLKNDNLALRKQVMELRTELEAASRARASLIKSMAAAGGKGLKGLKQEQLQKELIPGVRTYTIEPGDTLASIARKFYKSPGRWKDIQDANFSGMEGTAKLKPGMVLMVP